MLKIRCAVLSMVFLGLILGFGCDDSKSNDSPTLTTDELGYDGDPYPPNSLGNIDKTSEYLVYFDTVKLLPYVGWKIKKIKICYNDYSGNPATHDFAVHVYGKGTTTTPGSSLFTGSYTFTKGWNTVTLSSPLVIGSDTEIWAGYATSLNLCLPVSVDNNPYEDNKNWTSPDNNGLYGEWSYNNLNIRIIVQDN